MSLKLSECNEKLRQRILSADKEQNGRAVGGLGSAKPKQPAIQALERSVQKPAGRKSRVEIRVAIIQLRRRLLDGHDNLRYAAKPLVDAIAETIGLDDADPRISWEYSQVKCHGAEGVVVRIEAV